MTVLLNKRQRKDNACVGRARVIHLGLFVVCSLSCYNRSVIFRLEYLVMSDHQIFFVLTYILFNSEVMTYRIVTYIENAASTIGCCYSVHQTAFMDLFFEIYLLIVFTAVGIACYSDGCIMP